MAQDVRVDHLDTALEARVKVALSSATSQHLRLDHELILAFISASEHSAAGIAGLTKALSDALGLFSRESRQRLGGGDAVLDVS
jgi:hypothetical protein